MPERSQLFVLMAILATCVGGCRRVDPTFAADLEAWQADRVARLTAEEGWLSLVGLFWLDEGEQVVGSAPGSAVLLPPGRAASRLGTISKAGSHVVLRVEPGVEVKVDGVPVETVELRSDAVGEPSRIEHGRLVLLLIARGERLALRVKDRDRAAQVGLAAIPRYPVDPRWRISARWQAYDAPRRLAMPTVVGTQEEGDCPGVAVFEVNGASCRLEPTREGDELFFVFADATTGGATYGGGRFLVAETAKEGRVVLDFNRAYNPPCVFTPYATCPLPPRDNHLAVPIEAGERVPTGH